MNNKVRDTALPIDPQTGLAKLRNAVNATFTDEYDIILPRPGSTRIYTGNVDWLYEGKFVTIFVEGSDLKRLNDDYTATTLKTGFGSADLAATTVGDRLYVCSSTTLARIDANGNYAPWGTPRPPRNPDVGAVSYGGMFAGDYRVVVTWIAYGGDESGCGIGKRVTVAEGGGIQLTNFPTPPATVEKIGVYVTSVNSQDYYLYGEFLASTSDLTIMKQINTIPLATQFGYVPVPKGIVTAHYGRIYYGRGPRVYYTAERRYGLQFKNSYWTFDSDVQIIVSLPGVLYVGTQHRIYSVTNIDVPGQAPDMPVKIKAGAVKGSVAYHSDGKRAFFMSGRGVIEATSDGLKEATFEDVAMANFESGTGTIQNVEGSEIYVFVGQGATQNTLADTAYNTAEIARGSL
jgi:hypothetical protein